MKLSTFITHNMDAIAADWAASARTLLPTGETLTRLALHDHAPHILAAIAADIDSGGNAGTGTGLDVAVTHTAAATRAALRLATGVQLAQLGTELRALRACVISLWTKQILQTDVDSFHALRCFHEAIDMALAESIAHCEEQAERSRNLFIGMLGHDLRAPLGAIAMSCQYLARPNLPPDRMAEAVARVSRSAETMGGMIRELLDFARARLGRSIPITRAASDLRAVCRAVLDEMHDAHPRCEFLFDMSEELTLDADAERLHQLLWNLLSNAVQHGARGRPITLSVRSAPDAALLQVKNHGPAIPDASLQAMFDPLLQFAHANDDSGVPASLGLGLFIAHEIACAHGGDISVSSTVQDGTVFTVRLPKT